jgi:hypothetical protein
MRGLDARLQRLERNHQSRSREDPEFNADLACLGRLELRRGYDALMAGIDGDAARAKEAMSLLTLAHARRLEGWTQADRDALKKQDDEKQDAAWRLTHTLGERHKAYPDVHRFDVLDLTEAEIKQLAEATETATCASDLDAVAEVVRRLRLDGKVMDMVTFEALVLRGEIAAR